MASGKLRSSWLVVAVLVFGVAAALGLRAFMHARRVEPAPPPAPTCDVLVRVVASGISVDGAFVLALEDVDLEGGPKVIPPLHAELAARGKSCVAIQSDKQVLFKIIKAVMLTATAAGYADIRFKTL